MTELMRALMALFARAGLPVALRGWVPADAPRPLLILSVEAPDRLKLGGLTAECRFRGGRDADGRRLAAMDALAALVPPGGRTLTWPGGCAMLRRADTGFRELSDEPGGAGEAVGRLRFTLWTC